MYFLGAHSSEGSSAVDILYAIICVICFFFFVIPRAFSSSKKKKPQAKRPVPVQDFRQVVFDEPRQVDVEDNVKAPTEDFWKDNAPQVAPKTVPAKRVFHVVPQTSVAPTAKKKSPNTERPRHLAKAPNTERKRHPAIFATRKELRDAVLASEILGKPKALRDTPEPWEMF